MIGISKLICAKSLSFRWVDSSKQPDPDFCSKDLVCSFALAFDHLPSFQILQGILSLEIGKPHYNKESLHCFKIEFQGTSSGKMSYLGAVLICNCYLLRYTILSNFLFTNQTNHILFDFLLWSQ